MSPPEHDAIEDRLRAEDRGLSRRRSRLCRVKLGLPETMGAKAWTAARLAAALDVSAPHLERVLRGLATLGLVAERPDEVSR